MAGKVSDSPGSCNAFPSGTPPVPRRARGGLAAAALHLGIAARGCLASGRRLATAALDLIAPRTCAHCHELLEGDARGLCIRCREDLPWIAAACPRCGTPAARPPSGPRAACAWCGTRKLGFHLAAAGGLYEGPLRAAVIRFKFHRETDVLPVLAEALRRAARAEGVREAVAEAGGLVPVPSHPWRRWVRGWEPVAELAAAATGSLVPGRALPILGLLRKRRWTPRQTGLTEDERRRSPRGAFQARARRSCPPTVVLLDDVLTTGATATDAARALRRAGARRVVLLAVARS